MSIQIRAIPGRRVQPGRCNSEAQPRARRNSPPEPRRGLLRGSVMSSMSSLSRALRSVRIMPRVLFALFVPSLGLVLASSIIVAEKRATVSEMQKLTSLAGLATHVSALVHELQKERGASALFLGSKGQAMQHELPEQRA